jgi:intracellular sulfur oxidation DsrE/DsrF family protein
MERRRIFRALAAAAALTPFAAKAVRAEGKKRHKLVLHVGANSEDSMKTALGNAKNAHELFAKRGEDVSIEIVANSGGLHMLRDDTSPVKAEIQSLRKLDPTVVFSACNNTKTGMEKKEGKTIPILSEAVVVPAGVVRIVELEEQGYAYMRP